MSDANSHKVKKMQNWTSEVQ